MRQTQTLLAAICLLLCQAAWGQTLWRANFDAGTAAFKIGQNRKATTLLTSALEEIEKSRRANEQLADTLVALGECYQCNSEPKKATEFYTRALAIYRSLENSAKTASTQLKLHSTMTADEWAKTGVQLSDLEQDLIKHEGKDSPDVFKCRALQALKLAKEQKFAEAKSLSAAIQKDARRALAKQPDKLASVLAALAYALYRSRDFDEGLALTKECLTLRVKNLAPGHPDTASADGDVGLFLYSVGNRGEARVYLQRSIQGFKDALGENTPRLMVPLNNLALLNHSESRTAEEIDCYEKALALCEANLGAESPESATISMNLAASYITAGKYDDAERLLDKTLAIKEKQLGKNHVEISYALGELANLRIAQNKLAEAEELYKRALGIQEKAFGENHKLPMATLRKLKELYVLQKKHPQAEAIQKTIVARCEKLYGPESPETADALYQLTRIYWSQEGPQPDLLAITQRIYNILARSKKPNALLAQIAVELATKESLVRNWQEAFKYYEAADAAYTKIEGENGKNTKSVKRQWAVAAAKAKKASDKHVQMMLKVLELDRKSSGPRSKDVALDYEALGSVYAVLGRMIDAREAMRISISIAKELNLYNDKPSSTDSPTSGSSPLATTSGDAIGDKYAVVIGIGTYKDKSLSRPCAAQDAKDFAEFLVKDAGFAADHVQLLTDADATRANILANVGERLGAKTSQNDLVTVYIAGVAEVADEMDDSFQRSTIVLPYDANQETALSQGLPVDWLKQIIKQQVRCKQLALILDTPEHAGAKGMVRVDSTANVNTTATTNASANTASSSGANAPGNPTNEAPPAHDAPRVAADSCQLVVKSCRPGQKSWEVSSGKNSIFLTQLVDHLNKSGKDSTLQKSFSTFRQSVEEAANTAWKAKQTPSLTTSGAGGFNLFVVRTQASAPQQSTPAVQAPSPSGPTSEPGLTSGTDKQSDANDDFDGL
jgi:Tfp pilus assembly protein PilF